MKPANINACWCSLIIEELRRCGVTCFCLSPGSRCTPLTVACADNNRVRKCLHFDERGAAFHAVGYARATGQPAALVCTSGTAAVDYFPAVVEASMDMVPLIVITADRPPELRQTEANQTIDQVKLYGNYVRWQVDMPCPDEKIDPRMVLTTVDQAVYRAHRSPAGPVHLNCMFREPLVPIDDGADLSVYTQPLNGWESSDKSYTDYRQFLLKPDEVILDQVTDLIKQTDTGFLIIGKLNSTQERKAVLTFAHRMGWPALADITSGLRFVADDVIIPHYDLILYSDKFATVTRPSTILHLGGRFVSRRLQNLIERIRPQHYLHISDHPERLDPGHVVTDRIECDLTLFCRYIIDRSPERSSSAELDRWRATSLVVEKIVDKMCSEPSSISEPAIARSLTKHLADNSGLFVANSMPVRNLDMFATTLRGILNVAANRGASGIDGVIASATGFAAGLGRPITLLIGDLACLHDLNSLALVKEASVPITVVIVNNNGGGLFEFLPIAQFKEVFEKYFITPHGYTFEHTSRMFDLPYVSINSNTKFVKAYISAQEARHSSIIEVTINRAENRQFHRRLTERINSALTNI